MNRFLLSLLWLVAPLSAALCQPRLIVSNPVAGGVYQRDDSGSANIVVQGSYNSSSFWFNLYTTAQATLTKLDLTTGQPVQPEVKLTIPVSKVFGTFRGSLYTPAGWYRLDVAIKLGNTTLGNPYSSKVGVGEVFVIAGQSNAQGLKNQIPEYLGVVARPLPVMDAVRVQPNLFNEQFIAAINTSELQDVRFMSNFPDIGRQKPPLGSLIAAKDDPSTVIAPLGPSLWFWGALGEKIATTKSVPVAFYNAAFGGTTVTNWWDSIDPNKESLGIKTGNTENNRFSKGAPYGFLKNTLKFYGSLFGVRAILWHQGETDTKTLREPNSWPDYDNPLTNQKEVRRLKDAEDYKKKLSDLIAESRKSSTGLASPVTWVVGKTSFIENNFDQYSLVVRQGQENLINAGISKVFRGPDTDPAPDNTTGGIPLSERRTGGGEPTHFNQPGLSHAVQLWCDALLPLIGNNSPATPVTPQLLGTEPKSLEFNQDGTIVSAPAGYSSYEWIKDNNGSANPNDVFNTSRSVQVGSGGTPNANTNSTSNKAFDTGSDYRAVVTNGQGNFILTQAVPYPYTIIDDTGTPPATCAAPASGNCYTIKVQKTGLLLQTVNGGASIQQLAANNQANQIWKIEDTGSSRYRFTIQDGTNRVVQTTTGANGNMLALGNYNGDDKQRWGISAQNGYYRIFTSTNTTWDLLDFGNQATLQLYGTTAEPFQDYRSFCFTPATCPTTTPCDLNLTASNSNPNAQCNQSAQLTFTCSGNDCNGATFTWSGVGLNQTVSAGQSLGTGALGTNGSRTYTLTATKNGCQQTAQTTVTVSGCSPTGFALLAPTYTCNGTEGQLTVNVSGGNGATEYRVLGLRDWAANPNFTVPNHQRNGTTFTLQARQNGQEIQQPFTSSCSGPPPGCFAISPSASNPNPACNAGITLNANCGGSDCTGVTYTWSNNGLSGGGSSIGVTPPASSGSYTYGVSASKGGCPTQNGTVVVTVNCGGGPFALNPPSLNCAANTVTLTTSGGNGSAVEYQAIGLRGWSSDNVFPIPSWQRTGTNFTFQARQSGTEVSQSLTTNCTGPRLGVASSEPDSDDNTGLVISPNPSSGRVSVRFRLGAGERGSVSVQSLTGAVLQSRAVVGTGAAQTEVLDMEREPSGLYLIGVSGGGGNKAQTGRVLLLR